MRWMLAQESCDIKNNLQIILFENFNTYNSCYIFPKMHLIFPEELVGMQYSITRTEKRLEDHNRNYPGDNCHFPGAPNDARWIVVPETKIHFMDSLLLTYLKYKARASSRTSSCCMQSYLDQFRPSGFQ